MKKKELTLNDLGKFVQDLTKSIQDLTKSLKQTDLNTLTIANRCERIELKLDRYETITIKLIKEFNDLKKEQIKKCKKTDSSKENKESKETKIGFTPTTECSELILAKGLK
jgi:hypothetical protein